MPYDEQPPDSTSGEPPDIRHLIDDFNTSAEHLRVLHGPETAHVPLPAGTPEEHRFRGSAYWSGQRLNAARTRYREMARMDTQSFMSRIFEHGLVISEGAASIHLHRGRIPERLPGLPFCLVNEADYDLYDEYPTLFTMKQWTGSLTNLLEVTRTVVASSPEPNNYQAWGLSRVALTASIDDNGHPNELFQYYMDYRSGHTNAYDVVMALDEPPEPLNLASRMRESIESGIIELNRLCGVIKQSYA